MRSKAQPLGASAKSNLRDRVLCKVEKNSFFASPGKGGHNGLLPCKPVCPHPGGSGEESYSIDSRVGLLTRTGCVQGLCEPSSLLSGDLLDELL